VLKVVQTLVDVALSAKGFSDCEAWARIFGEHKVSRIWNLTMSFFFSCQLTMGRDDKTIV